MSDSKRFSSYSREELERRCARAEARLLDLERLLMKYVAQDRSSAVRRELLQGQPLLDLAAGQTPQPASEEAAGGEDDDGSDDDDEPDPGSTSRRKRRGGRRKLPAHLPREIKEYDVDPSRDLPDYDPAQGFRVIDHDTCEELVLPRPEPKVIVHKRPVVLYTTLEGETRLATVGGLSKVFPKCAASPSVLARITVDRLHNHLTLYRIARSFAELGCPLSRSTLCQWMIWLGRLLRPIARAQEDEIRAAAVRFADDTQVRVLAPGVCDGVKVWVLLADAPSGREVVFKYTESRWALRQLASRPLLARIGSWVAEQRDAEPLESSFRKALNYVVNQWDALKRFLEDGRLRLDNNLSEAEFHVVGVGRRNWLFFGSREGLQSALVLYGLIRSCVANRLDPYLYLQDVIRRVASTETPARDLIPSRWKQLPPLPAEARAAATTAAEAGTE